MTACEVVVGEFVFGSQVCGQAAVTVVDCDDYYCECGPHRHGVCADHDVTL